MAHNPKMRIVPPQHIASAGCAKPTCPLAKLRPCRPYEGYPADDGRRIPPSNHGSAGRRGFTLVEVTLALGLVSFALLSLLGLFVVGLTSSRDSSLETALSRIALHVASTYNPQLPNDERAYSFEGGASNAVNFQKYFTVNVSSTNSTITNTSSNLKLITISIKSANNPGTTNVIQTAAFIP